MANSYKDPYWSKLSANTEKLLKLPNGLLQNIVLHGERSNADQVSSVGAKTVFQITPTTRNLVLKKYGLDAFLNDKNAAMAAGLLLQESLKRNNGSVEAAIGEYHGGTDRKNWGPINKAYRQRVSGAMSVNTQPQQTQSTFQRVRANFQQEQAPTIAKVYDAYQSGKLNSQQKKDFENDVRSGVIMLPEGGQLLGKAKAQPVMLPQSVSDAYANGKLSEQQRSDLELDIKAGLVKLPVASKNKSDLPDFDASGRIAQEPTEQGILPAPKPEASLGQKISGGLEAAATVGSGLIGAPIGQTIGTIKGAAQSLIDGNFGTPQGAQNILNTANTAAHALTYEPKTAVGQENVQGIGEFIQDVGLDTLPPVMGGIGVAAGTLGGASVPIVSGAARDLAQATSQAVQRPIQATTNAIRSGVDGLKDAVGLNRDTGTNPAPANIGAAQVDQATIRDALAQDLPYPPQLTQGQLTRDPGQLKFETETAKNSNLGTPLRQRYEEQHEVMQQNLEAFIDDTGAQATNMREVGLSVDSALQKQMKADKNRVRVAYAKADKSNEALLPVDLTQPVRNGNDTLTVLDYLNSQPDLKSTPIISDAKSIATKLGIANKDSNGDLIPASPTVQQMEKWRSEINQNTNLEPTNVRQTAILKSLIDQHVEPVAGPLYRAARVERKRMADHWENRAIIKDLTTNKTGSSDRKVALEDVQKRIIHDGSLDDMRFAKRTLLTSGEEGKQAWRDIQGQTLQEIKLEATKGVAPDARGNQMISPAALNTAINKLDKSGKLDFIFGKQGAEKLRAVNEISKTLFTVPTSAAINHSNTAATLTAAMDIALSGMSGFPAPVASALRLATKHIKDNKVRARVQKALNPQRTT